MNSVYHSIGRCARSAFDYVKSDKPLSYQSGVTPHPGGRRYGDFWQGPLTHTQTGHKRAIGLNPWSFCLERKADSILLLVRNAEISDQATAPILFVHRMH